MSARAPWGALLLAACGLGGSPTMRPGSDCLHCHDGGRARRWTAAGTVYPKPDSDLGAGVLDAHISIRDANGWTFSVQSNIAGNFYTAEAVAFPIQVCVEYGGATSCMAAPVEYGGCNACHNLPPSGGTAGRIFVP